MNTSQRAVDDTAPVRGLSAVAQHSFSNVHEAAQAIFELIHELVGMRICVLTRIDLEANTLTVLDALDRAGLGVVRGMALRAEDMPCACVARRGPIREYDLDAHPAFRVLPARTKLGLRSYIGVPLRRSSGEIWGTLAAADTEKRDSTDADLQMLTVLARLAMFEYEREEQQQALAAAVRFQTLLEAAAAVSHEVNNPLTVLMLRLTRLRTRGSLNDPETLDDLDVAVDAANEIRSVTERLRKVVRPVSTRYYSGTRMLDLAASSEPSEEADFTG